MSSSMFVTMMDVGIVPMRVRQFIVPVSMRMGLLAIPFDVVRVQMMGIVCVFVRVAGGLVRVLVRMVFRDVQPDSGQHQECGDPE